MDPDKCYEELRTVSGRLKGLLEVEAEKPGTISTAAIQQYAQVLVDRVEAMDKWLRSGGFLPAMWKRG